MSQTLPYHGVSFVRAQNTKPWKASLTRRGTAVYLGSYASPMEAADAVDAGTFHLSAYALHKPVYNFPEKFTSLLDVPPRTVYVERALANFRQRFPEVEKNLAMNPGTPISDRLDRMAETVPVAVITQVEQMRTELRMAAGRIRFLESQATTDKAEIERLLRTVKGLENMGGQQLFTKVSGVVVPASPVDKHLEA